MSDSTGASTYRAPQIPDYVPVPRPVSTDYLIGAHYFPGWKQGTHWGWEKVVPYPERTPLLGYYDEGSPEVADWEIKWCLEHGVGFFVYCWYREIGNVGKPVTPSDARLGHAIHEGLFRARYADRFRFAIMWENYGDRGKVASAQDLMDNLLPFWLENYFRRPNYLVLDNRPVLFVYHFDSLLAQLGGLEGARGALEAMREACRRAGFDGLTLMCEHRGADVEFLKRVRECGFDAAFAYCWHPGPQFPTADEAISYQLTVLNRWKEADVLPFVPTASMGWDPMPWRSDSANAPWLHADKMKRWLLSGEDFRSLLEKIKDFMAGLSADSPGHRIALLDNWNEWGEGHYIAPHAAGGFSYLQAVREVFTRRDNLPDYRTPAQLGLGPYDGLWRKA